MEQSPRKTLVGRLFSSRCSRFDGIRWNKLQIRWDIKRWLSRSKALEPKVVTELLT